MPLHLPSTPSRTSSAQGRVSHWASCKGRACRSSETSMPQSFKQLAAEPGSPLSALPGNAGEVVAWLRQAQTKLEDARQEAISPGTRMDAAWDAVLLASLAVASAQGWRATSDPGHHTI